MINVVTNKRQLIYFPDNTSCVPSNETDCIPCNMTGNWINDLGSNVEFSCHDGLISGRYNSAVGVAKDFYILSGGYTKVGPGLNDLIVGWTVAYNNEVKGNSNSTASFTGVYYESNDTIYTTWILTRYTPAADMWTNSYIGKNVFTRVSVLFTTTSQTSPAGALTRSSADPLRQRYTCLMWLTAFIFVKILAKFTS